MPEAAETTPPGAAAPAAGTFQSPLMAFHWLIELDGLTAAHFHRCIGIGMEIQMIRYREGGENQVVHNLPGLTTWNDFTLLYGLTVTSDLWDWLEQTAAGQIEPRNCSIVHLGPDGATEVLRYNARQVLPRAWRGAELDALRNEAAFESVTLCCESIHRA